MGHRHHYISPPPIREAMGAGLMEVMAGKVGGFEGEERTGTANRPDAIAPLPHCGHADQQKGTAAYA